MLKDTRLEDCCQVILALEMDDTIHEWETVEECIRVMDKAQLEAAEVIQEHAERSGLEL